MYQRSADGVFDLAILTSLKTRQFCLFFSTVVPVNVNGWEVKATSI